MSTQTKVCKVCGQEKSIEEMATRGKNKAGERVVKNTCKKCANQIREKARQNNKSEARIIADKRRQDKFRLEHKDKLKEKYLMQSFGMRLDQYNQILLGQNGTCAICDSSASRGGKMLAVDHNHDTGKIRGLLCSDCNTALGLLKDSPDVLNKAMGYLLKHLEVPTT